MVIRLVLCLLIVACSEGAHHRSFSFKKIQKNFERNLRTNLLYPFWHRHRIDPWALPWTSRWRYERVRNDLNIASVKRRKSWTKFKTRRSKWGKFYAKQHENNVNKITTELKDVPWTNRVETPSLPQSAKLESASNYAIPTWLRKLRNTYNEEKNHIGYIQNSIRVDKSKYSNSQRPKWNDRESLNPPSKFANKDAHGENVPLSQWLDQDLFQLFPKETDQEIENPSIKKTENEKPVQPIDSLNGNLNQRGELNGMNAFDDDLSGVFFPSGDAADEIGASGNKDVGLQDAFAMSNGKMETRQGDFPKDTSISGGQGFGAIGSWLPSESTDDQSSSGSSFGQIDEPLKPDERSGNPNLDSGFGSFDDGFLPPDQDYYSAYMDFDESGFGTFGGFGPYDEGSFITEGFGAIGSWLPSESTDDQSSSGSSFGQIDEPLKPDERSGNPNLDSGFGSFDDGFLPPDQDYYSAYMDFDESGFGTFGGFGPYDEGSFITEDENCEGIDERSCHENSECNCMGMYFCVKGTCSTMASSSENSDMPDEMKGIWHETPMGE